MKRNAIKRWTEACLLGSALATGCSQFRSGVNDHPRSGVNDLPWAAYPAARPKSEMPMVAAQRKVEEPQAQLAPNVPAPATLPAAAPEQQAMVKDATMPQTAIDSSKPSPVESATVRKAPADPTAAPCFDHAKDYTCLSGQLQHSHITKSWRLRYASVDEVDLYGGSVTLINDEKLAGVKDGDLVRVQGRLVNPQDKEIAPPYEIDSIQRMGKRE